MSDQTTKYLLHLNWGYRLGFWTWHLHGRHLTVTTSDGRLHNFISWLVTAGVMAAHVGVIGLMLYYEWGKSYRDIPETILVVGTVILMLLLIVIHLSRLQNPGLPVMVLRNTLSLRRIYGMSLYTFNLYICSGMCK